MNTKNATAIHERGLTVLAIATAFLQLPTAHAAARHADLRDYQATYRAIQGPQAMAPAWHNTTCADAIDSASGERGCSSITGGPAGGLINSN